MTIEGKTRVPVPMRFVYAFMAALCELGGDERAVLWRTWLLESVLNRPTLSGREQVRA